MQAQLAQLNARRRAQAEDTERKKAEADERQQRLHRRQNEMAAANEARLLEKARMEQEREAERLAIEHFKQEEAALRQRQLVSQRTELRAKLELEEEVLASACTCELLYTLAYPPLCMTRCRYTRT